MCALHCLQVIAKLTREYVHDILPDMHAEQYGLSREIAELEFLKVRRVCLCVYIVCMDVCIE